VLTPDQLLEHAENVRRAVEHNEEQELIFQILDRYKVLRWEPITQDVPFTCGCSGMLCQGGLVCPNRIFVGNTSGPGWPD
jgi:hypothetical protein